MNTFQLGIRNVFLLTSRSNYWTLIHLVNRNVSYRWIFELVRPNYSPTRRKDINFTLGVPGIVAQ